MGIHLILKRVKGVIKNDDELGIRCGEPTEWLDTEEVQTWDTLRQAGDKDFNYWVDKTYHPIDDELWKPSDIDFARKWIARNVPNPERLIAAMNLLESDENIWFLTSY